MNPTEFDKLVEEMVHATTNLAVKDTQGRTTAEDRKRLMTAEEKVKQAYRELYAKKAA